MTARSLVLVGAPGAGKTTVGAILAERWGVPVRDTDADVVATLGKPVADVFVEDGEPVFRTYERVAVALAVEDALVEPQVVSPGGGAVLDEGTRALLRSSGIPVVWLEVAMAGAVKRVGLARDRPILALNPRAALHRLLAERAPLYAEVATVRVATDGLTADEVADAVEKALSPARTSDGETAPAASPAHTGDGESGPAHTGGAQT